MQILYKGNPAIRLEFKNTFKEIIYYQENGFVVTIDDIDYVFAKISDEVIMPEDVL